MTPPARQHDDTGVEHHVIPSFKFTNGTTLQDVKVAYRSYNASSTAGTILIGTCFGRWINETLTFTNSPNNALSRYHVIVVAMLGNGESSSPSNKPFFPEPGELRYEDMIRAYHHMLTKGLGVTKLEAVIGFSMGGQQAYHWAIMYPDFVKRIVGICTSARTSPHNYAFLEGPVAAMMNSLDYIAWREVKAKAARGEKIGHNLSEVKPRRGLIAFGRTKSAWNTSAEWFRNRCWESPGNVGSVEEWLVRQGDDCAAWDADDLLALARAWQMGDIGTTSKGETTQLGWPSDDDQTLKAALGAIKCPVLLMPCSHDQFFRPVENEFEMKYLKQGRLEVIESVWGHSAGGGGNPEDAKFMNEKIAQFLAET